MPFSGKEARALASAIVPDEVDAVRAAYAADPRFNDERAVDVATLLECAYPAAASMLHAHPEDAAFLLRSGRNARDLRAYKKLAVAGAFDFNDPIRVRANLRRFASREKLRIMWRELQGEAGAASAPRAARDLAEVASTSRWARRSCGPTRASGSPRARVRGRRPRGSLPPGRSGGRQRVGFVASGWAARRARAQRRQRHRSPAPLRDRRRRRGQEREVTDTSLHEYFTRVAQRMTSTLDEPSEHGIVFRVDLRLRPEGSRGPLVNALAAAERYYESWGRTWERVAMVRARPVAGDLALGEEILKALSPFVWRREVNPLIADEMVELMRRTRAEIGERATRRDLKLGQGGIREAEFFVQSLQLIWGGRQPSLRSTNTIDALKRLRAHGLVTEREAREVEGGYLALRRLEHRVQFATGLQTHALPEDRELLGRIARSLGFGGAVALEKDVERIRRRLSPASSR